MPMVFRERGFRFHFFSNEGDPLEPMHIHVAKEDLDAKVWLHPDVAFAYNKGYDARTERWILSVVEARKLEIEEAWNDHFS